MSESDLISAYQGAEEIWQGYVSIFVSVVFAYLVVAYLVGAKLSRAQTAIVTALYSLFGFSFLILIVAIFIRMQNIGSDLYEINPTRTMFAATGDSGGPFGQFVLYGPFVGAFVAGLLFMFQIRRNAKKRVSAAVRIDPN